MRYPLSIALLFAAWSAIPAAASPGQMTRDDTLRAGADAEAAAVGQIARGTSVDILARQGGWTQVGAAGKTGWVRILSVKALGGAGAGDVAGLVEATTTKRDPGKVVSVAGLRGLNEEELKQARFNPGELQRLEQFALPRGEAESFGRDAGLRPAKLGYLPKPKGAGDKAGQDNIWGLENP